MERHKEVRINWKYNDESRLSECKHISDIREICNGLNKPVQQREFTLSRLTVLLLFKILFGLSYRGIANATKDLKIYQVLGMKRAPCYKTIQNTIAYPDEWIRCVAEAIFSGTERRFGEYLFGVQARFRRIEGRLRTLLGNVVIYPR